MVAFLSPEWIEALDAAARVDPALAAAAVDVDLIVEQCVTAGPEAPGDADGDVVYHLVLQKGVAAVRAGPAEDPTVRFIQDRDTAWGIATGTISAQAAFMTGRLQVGGDLRSLLDDRLASALTDVFAAVRSTTTLDGAPAEADA